MTKTLRFVGIVVLICLQIHIAAQVICSDSLSCDKCICCTSIDPTPAGQMISHVHEKGEWMVSTRFMHTNMIDINKGSDPIDKSLLINTYGSSPDHMRMNMFMFMAMYGVSERITLMTMINYMDNFMVMDMRSGNTIHHHVMHSSGLADSKLSVLYALARKPTYQLIVSGGIGFPTGSINNIGNNTSMMYMDKRYPYMMQNGSGSFELLPGLCYTNRVNKLTYSALLNGVKRLNKNANGYKLGDELQVSFWTSYLISPVISSSIRLEANHTDKIKGTDESLNPSNDIAANTNNTGANKLNALIGLNYKLITNSKLKITLYGEYGLPLYQNVNGTQQITNQLANFSLAITF